MNRCDYNCLNCAYKDCVKPNIDREHTLAQVNYRNKHPEKVKTYQHNYYLCNKARFKLNKQKYMESIYNDPDKLNEYRKKKRIYNQRYRDRKRMEKELCQN